MESRGRGDEEAQGITEDFGREQEEQSTSKPIEERVAGRREASANKSNATRTGVKKSTLATEEVFGDHFIKSNFQHLGSVKIQIWTERTIFYCHPLSLQN